MLISGRPVGRFRRRLAYVYFAGAVILLLWATLLAFVLPDTMVVRRWSLTWVGLDTMEAAGLAATGWLLVRRHPAVSLVAGVTAGLLFVDGWFDMTTAPIGWEYLMALSLAAVVEFPVAGLCLLVGYRAIRRPTVHLGQKIDGPSLNPLASGSLAVLPESERS